MSIGVTPYETLTFCQKAAPTGTVQQGFTNLYNTLHKAGETDEAIVYRLVMALADGVMYGNWPTSAVEG